MKLFCEVEILHRDAGISGVSLKRRSVKSTLAIGKEPKKEKSYFMLHFSSSNKLGTRYKLNENIQQVFGKFCHEGKATLRLKIPAIDICIKNSDVNQLKTFLKCLKMVLEGNTEGLKLANLSNISVTSVKPPQSKLCIRDISKYPKHGLPRTLEDLEISEIGMSTFKREILSLKYLIHLNLSHNNLHKLPKELGTLPNLKRLILSHNKLGCSESLNWSWLEGTQIRKNLEHLDLSFNQIGSYIPCTISMLHNLVVLCLQDNSIATLPHSLARITSLRFLNLANNKLHSLPGSIRTLDLDELDISGNYSEAEKDLQNSNNMKELRFNLGSLVEISGEFVLNKNIYYAKGMIPLTLVHYLNTSRFCVCGKAVFNCGNCLTIKHMLTNLFRTVKYDTINSEMDFECYFCSFKCFKDRSRFFA